MSERHACRLLGQWRGTQRYRPLRRTEEDALTRAIIALATQYGRYGYRRITALLQSAGWQVGKDRVQRIWRREGLKVPQRQPKRGRLWLNDGSCVRLRPSTVHDCPERIRGSLGEGAMKDRIYQAGQRLRQIREEYGLTLRDVEEQSRRIAEEMQLFDYLITAGRLSQVENSNSLPSLYKLATLSFIYKLPLTGTS